MKIKVWLKGHENDNKVIELKGLRMDPITPMNVRDHLCRTGFFSWAEYQRIRYRRLKDGKTYKKIDKVRNPRMIMTALFRCRYLTKPGAS